MGDNLIEYNNELLSLHAISAKAGVPYSALVKYYSKFNDIYDAINMARYKKDKKNFAILYEGDLYRLEAIARVANVNYGKLVSAFKETGNIYKAVSMLREETPKERVDIIKETAIKEKIDEDLLRRFYAFYKDLDKSVIVARYETLKKSILKIDDITITREEFSRRLNIPILLLNERLDNRISAKQIAEENSKFSAINNPKGYQPFLNFLEKRYGINSEIVMQIMESDNCRIEDALVKYLFITDEKINRLETSWLLDMYRYIMSFNDKNKHAEISSKYLLSDTEKQVLNSKFKQMKILKKAMYVQDFANKLSRTNGLPDKTLLERMREKEVTLDEVMVAYSFMYGNENVVKVA